jgi:hypothetical protein
VDAQSAPAIISVGLRWPDRTNAPLAANQFLAQISPGPNGVPEAVLLSVGHVSPPVLLASTPDDLAKLAKAVRELPIVELGQFSISRARAEELMNLLKVILDRWDAVATEEGGEPK